MNQNEKKDRPQRTIEERFLVVNDKGQFRQMTDQDTPKEGRYVILPKFSDSKAVPELLVQEFAVGKEKVKSAVLTCPTLQEDGTWVAKLDIHPVVLRRLMLAKARRTAQLAKVETAFGSKVAGLFRGGK